MIQNSCAHWSLNHRKLWLFTFVTNEAWLIDSLKWYSKWNYLTWILIFSETKWVKGLDQVALDKVVWPLAKEDLIAHDSYTCNTFKSNGNKPWPTQRISGPKFSEPEVLNFVGSNGGKISMKQHGACPEQCRPIAHPEWLLCWVSKPSKSTRITNILIRATWVFNCISYTCT